MLGRLQFCFAYLDDDLVWSSSESEHLKHLQYIFQRFLEVDLLLNVKKRAFVDDLITSEVIQQESQSTSDFVFPASGNS